MSIHLMIGLNKISKRNRFVRKIVEHSSHFRLEGNQSLLTCIGFSSGSKGWLHERRYGGRGRSFWGFCSKDSGSLRLGLDLSRRSRAITLAQRTWNPACWAWSLVSWTVLLASTPLSCHDCFCWLECAIWNISDLRFYYLGYQEYQSVWKQKKKASAPYFVSVCFIALQLEISLHTRR